MTTLNSNLCPTAKSGEIEDAASILVNLKEENDKPKEDRCSMLSQGNEQGHSSSITCLPSKSAWNDMFHSVKQDLSFIEHFVTSVTKHSSGATTTSIIENVFRNVESVTLNGYVVILYSVTTVCNEFRKLLHESFATAFTQKVKLVQNVGLLYKIIHYINKYESHIWQEQLYHCKNSLPENELVTFKTLLNDIKPIIDMAIPTERVIVLDAIHQNMICIKMTGLLARHAYRHVTHILQHVCNIKMSGYQKCGEKQK